PESLACGTAVITTKGVDIWPELEQGGGARIIEPNVGDLAAAISELLSDPGALKMMGERGRESVFDWLDTDRVVGQFMAMYEQARVAPS
ncbi:MAG: glycosyltransferase, partial [Planctomycetota bacterium]|nr:glycosyltransferase [Planctomycetota bacterium]